MLEASGTGRWRTACRLYRDARRQARELLAPSPDQSARYESLRSRFALLYEEIRDIGGASEFVTPWWRRKSRSLEALLLPLPPPSIDYYYVRARPGPAALGRMLKLLEARFPPWKLKEVLRADLFCGGLNTDEEKRADPLLRAYLTNHLSLYHLHALAEFERLTGARLDENGGGAVVEWGGGFGNLAKIFTRAFGGTRTYVIVDLPASSCLQWLYLATMLGEDRVAVVKKKSSPLELGKINLVPIQYARSLRLRADLFISTLALDESSRAAWEFVLDKKYFGAGQVLLAYSQGDFSRRVRSAARAQGFQLFSSRSGPMLIALSKNPREAS